MKYCPLCAGEYREGYERCATCGATLVPSLTEDIIRANPPRLLWIGGSIAEFDAVAGALHEANIPALVEEGPGRIVPRFLRSESQICVLQSDFQRALETAAREIASLPDDVRSMEDCRKCGTVCSTALAACPNCLAALLLEQDAGSDWTEDPPVPLKTGSKYCPTCNSDYPASYQHCSKCGIELVPEEMRGMPLKEQDLQDKIDCLAWRGSRGVEPCCEHLERTRDSPPR